MEATDLANTQYLGEYMFFSHPHNSYARLDYIQPLILANSTAASIHNCVWSDHQITSFATKFIKLAPIPYSIHED